MIDVDVTRLEIGDTKTAQISVAQGTSVYLCLMQARSQGLEFDLETSDVYLNMTLVPHEAIRSTRVKEPSIILIRPSNAQRSVIELD